MREIERQAINFEVTGIFDRLADVLDKRIICLYGGSSSSKTISALQYLTIVAEMSKESLVITVVGESVPVIKRSVFRDWQRVVMKGRYIPDRFNKNDNTYTFENGSILQFIPADEEARFFAMRHDYVLIDEAYNVKKGIFDQIEIRTRTQILLTWNPVSPFWGTKLEDERDDVAVIQATYKDNPFIEKSIIDALEKRANTDPNFYRVFVLGKYGTLEGLIFEEGRNWFKCDELPEDYKRRIFVIDYGFTADPTAILEIRYSNGEFWIDEIEYKSGLFNRDIFAILFPEAKNNIEIVADSAEPKSNAELRQMGLNIIGAVKGPDSVKFGLRTMKEFKINITKRSINTIKEFRNYSRKKDKHGVFTDEPIDDWNHGIDATRYGITHIRKNPTYGKYAIS